jgi:Na+/glutamate symporter
MAHIGDLILAFGIVLGVLAGIAVGWWLRGRRRKAVI